MLCQFINWQNTLFKIRCWMFDVRRSSFFLLRLPTSDPARLTAGKLRPLISIFAAESRSHLTNSPLDHSTNYFTCRSISSTRSITSIFPSILLVLMASSIFAIQNGQAVTITVAPASFAISTLNCPILLSSMGS